MDLKDFLEILKKNRLTYKETEFKNKFCGWLTDELRNYIEKKKIRNILEKLSFVNILIIWLGWLITSFFMAITSSNQYSNHFHMRISTLFYCIIAAYVAYIIIKELSYWFKYFFLFLFSSIIWTAGGAYFIDYNEKLNQKQNNYEIKKDIHKNNVNNINNKNNEVKNYETDYEKLKEKTEKIEKDLEEIKNLLKSIKAENK